mgnify:CR=1 FL=1
MNTDFIRIKSLEGELKIAHSVRDAGMTVTTREFVLQKPHVNYHIRLEDIVSIVPCAEVTSRPARIVRSGANVSEVTSFTAGNRHYRLRASRVTVHNRSGMFEMGATDFVLPIRDEVLQTIVRYAGLNRIDA